VRFAQTLKANSMKYSIVLSAVLMLLTLSACERPTVVAPVVAVPGPPGLAGATGSSGAQGLTGATGDKGAIGSTGDTGSAGERGKTGGDTVIVLPEAPAK
jgi:hypothetical protein